MKRGARPRPTAAAAKPRASDDRAPRASEIPAPPLSLRHPASLIAASAAAISIVVSVSFLFYDTDFWQHLLVGRTIWERHAIPRQHLWSWASYGTPEVLASWLFCALVWPFQAVGGVVGLLDRKSVV